MTILFEAAIYKQTLINAPGGHPRKMKLGFGLDFGLDFAFVLVTYAMRHALCAMLFSS